MEISVLQLMQQLQLKNFTTEDTLTGKISGAYVSDLLSDVMGNSKEGSVWITLQTHKNVVAIASLRDLPAVIFVNGLEPEKDTIEAANNEGIALLGTSERTFETSGKLYKILYS